MRIKMMLNYMEAVLETIGQNVVKQNTDFELGEADLIMGHISPKLVFCT